MYDFDKIVDRRGTSCLKYDFQVERRGRDDLLPLWVADMDFALPEEILDDIKDRISLEYAYLYPPGIPLLVPGERISGEVISQLLGYQKQGFSIEGIREQGRLEVISHG